MSFGAFINIFISIGLTPIVTRLYSKDEFGIYYIYVSIVGIIAMTITGMYPQAFVVPRLKRDFLALYKFCLYATIFSVLLSTFVLNIFGDYFLGILGGEKLIPFKYYIPLGLLFTSLSAILINANVRRKEFKTNSSSNVALSVSNKSVQLAYGKFVGGSFSGLILADICGKILTTFILGFKNFGSDWRNIQDIKSHEVRSVLVEYKKYPLFVLTGNFFNRFTSDLPLYILTSFFGLGAVGAFGFANQMLAIPYNVIGNSIAPVYFQRANELYLHNKEALISFTISSYNKMLILGALAFGFIFGFGDILFAFIFGSEWKVAGEFARILSIYYVFRIISSPFSRVFRVVKKEEYGLLINIIIAFFRILGISIGVFFNNLLISVFLFAIGNLIGYLITNVLIFRAIGLNNLKIFIPILFKITLIYSLYYLLRIIII